MFRSTAISLLKFHYHVDWFLRRPWYSIVAGVDWRENSTRVLQLPFGTQSNLFSEIKLEVRNMESSSDDFRSRTRPLTFLAHVIDVKNSQQSSPIPSSPSHESLYLKAGHSAVLELATRTSEASGGVLPMVRRLLVGKEPFFRISAVAYGECKSRDVPQHGAVLVAINGDDVRQLGDTVRKGSVGMQLWHPAVAQRRIILFSDPRCAYTLR